MKKENSSNVIRSTLLYTIGTIVNKAIGFLSIPIFSRLLTKAEYGATSTFESYVSILTVMIGLMAYETIRNAFVDYQKSINTYVKSTIELVYASFFVFLCVSIVLTLTDYNRFFPLLTIATVKALFVAISNIMSTYYMMYNHVEKRTILLVLPNLLGTVASLLVVTNIHANRDLGKIIPSIVVSFFFASFYTIKYCLREKNGDRVQDWKYALSISFPLIPHGLSAVLLASSDRAIISNMVGLEATGIYGISYNFGMLAFALITAFQSVWIPRLTRNLMNNSKDVVRKEAQVYSLFTGIIISIIMLCSKEIFMLFVDERYWTGVNILPPIIASSFLIHLYSIPADVEYYYKRIKSITSASICASLLNVILNFIFIKIYGYEAAAYTTVVSYVVLFVLHFIMARRIDKSILPFYTFAPSCILVVTAWLLSVAFVNLAILRWLVGIVISVGLLTLLAKNYKKCI